MLTIVLKILYILGILLLALFLLAVAVLLLILFVPITYRVSGAKDEDGFRISAKIKWLLGLVKLQYGYPEPGEVAAKVLFFTLYRAKIPPEESADDSGKAEDAADSSVIKRPSGKIMTALRKKKAHSESEKKNKSSKNNKSSKKNTDESETGKKGNTAETGNSDRKTASDSREAEADTGTANSEANTEKTASAEEKQKILQKFEKIKYTIHNIYDKIKAIWNNISYYLELLQEEETRQLFSHIRMRTGKMIKSVWPRHIRAEILFGTGSPDTTGYLYGVYCMISPMLKKGVNVTPDFEEAVLEADFDISGHVTVWVLASNACRIALDKRLWHLIKKAVPSGIKTTRKKAA